MKARRFWTVLVAIAAVYGLSACESKGPTETTAPPPAAEAPAPNVSSVPSGPPAAGTMTCDFISADVLSALVKKPLQPPRGREITGPGCVWLETGADPSEPSTLDAKLSVSISSTPSSLVGVPKGFPGFQTIDGVGDKAWVNQMPGADGFFGGALKGPTALKVSVTGPGATADEAIAVLRVAAEKFSF